MIKNEYFETIQNLEDVSRLSESKIKEEVVSYVPYANGFEYDLDEDGNLN